MSAFTDLDPEQLDAVGALAGRLKHDLGKYIAFGARWLGDDAPLAERTQALADDLLRTRRGPDGSSDALEVWEPYRARLVGERPLVGGQCVDLRDEPVVADIVQSMHALGPTVAGLRAGPLDRAAVDAGLALARRVSDACRALHRHLRELERTDG